MMKVAEVVEMTDMIALAVPNMDLPVALAGKKPPALMGPRVLAASLARIRPAPVRMTRMVLAGLPDRSSAGKLVGCLVHMKWAAGALLPVPPPSAVQKSKVRHMLMKMGMTQTMAEHLYSACL
jgi:hypothetical protein